MKKLEHEISNQTSSKLLFPMITEISSLDLNTLKSETFSSFGINLQLRIRLNGDLMGKIRKYL